MLHHLKNLVLLKDWLILFWINSLICLWNTVWRVIGIWGWLFRCKCSVGTAGRKKISKCWLQESNNFFSKYAVIWTWFTIFPRFDSSYIWFRLWREASCELRVSHVNRRRGRRVTVMFLWRLWRGDAMNVQRMCKECQHSKDFTHFFMEFSPKQRI